MQKKLIALAVAGLASTAAFAQSNVTVYGIVDVAGLYQDGQAAGKNQFSVNSGVLSTSRLGFKGVEDLGNGLKALFTLEYGLTADANNGIGMTATVPGGVATGNARQQFVGLTGNFGTAVAGRLQTTGLDYTVAGSALGGSAAIGATNVVGGGTLLTAVARANNAVAYISPSFSGLTLAVNHARMTEAALGTPTADAYANLVSASYANGPITAGLVYAKLSNANTIASDDNKEWGLRAGYDFGVAKLQAAYQQQKNDATAAVGKDKKYVISVSAPVSAKVAVIGEFASLSMDSTVAADDVKAITLASTYSLSKRTTAYAAINQRNPEGGNNNVNTYGVGLRHSF
ncbi:MAG: porin [Dechloromonas sp.]|nr:porin [Dechloromonas sp.]